MTASVVSVGSQRPPSAWPLGIALGVSLAVHVAIYLALIADLHRQKPPPPSDEITVEVRTVERPRPPPPPKPEPLPARKQPRLAVIKTAKPPPKAAPPPPNQPPPPTPTKAPPPPIRIGVNLESTVPGGAFAAPVGTSMYGQAADRAADSAVAAKPYWAATFVAPSQVAELPTVLDEAKAEYDPQARRDGIEGETVLMVTIDDQGKVVRVKKVSGVGHGLDEAAIEALKKFKFKPARYQGHAVATEIRYTYTWEID